MTARVKRKIPVIIPDEIPTLINVSIREGGTAYEGTGGIRRIYRKKMIIEILRISFPHLRGLNRLKRINPEIVNNVAENKNNNIPFLHTVWCFFSVLLVSSKLPISSSELNRPSSPAEIIS